MRIGRLIREVMLAAAVLLPLASGAQTRVNNYTCQSGLYYVSGNVDTLWMPMDNASTWRPASSASDLSSGSFPMGFDFFFMGLWVNTIEVTNTGEICLGRTGTGGMRGGSIHQFGDMLRMGPWPLGELKMKSSGVPGQRVVTCEFAMVSATDPTQGFEWQVQLSESDNSILLVMKGYGILGSRRIYVDFVELDANGDMLIYQWSSGRLFNRSAVPNLYNWPSSGIREYCRITPVSACWHPIGITFSAVTDSSATVSWTGVNQAVGYVLEYGPQGSSSCTTVNTTQTTVALSGLSPSTVYDVRLHTSCSTAETSDTLIRRIYTLCEALQGDVIFPYWDLYDSTVQCHTGTTNYPSVSIGVVDSGSYSDWSRHTVHSDPLERDSMTHNQLRTVPEGYCYSVRLGNPRVNAEQEDITYRIRVDTGRADLLILRYAIVEQNPNHPPWEQPHFILSILDEQDNLIDSCLYANFVAGDLSGWLNGVPGVVWHDWMAVGVDLAPLHGQVIRVRLDNADCTLSGHFGYAYFVLEYASKILTSTLCGEAQANTFIAPPGFAYRWYNADNPSVTLSTARQLHVTAEGNYCCRASYLHTTRDCGFTLTTRAGARYPVARFSKERKNSCGSEVHFVNQSVVASDSTRQNLTSEPCESYLWQFDDGTTSTATSPTHIFRTEGLHTVTLTAMLAGGTCSDLFTDTLTIGFSHDTVYDTVCPGEGLFFLGQWVDELGWNSVTDACGIHWLHLAYRDTTGAESYDAICAGDTLWMGGEALVDSGRYDIMHVNRYGCDSLVHVHLAVHPTYHQQVEDTLLLGGFLMVGDTLFSVPAYGVYTLHSVAGCDSVIEVFLSCVDRDDSTVCVDALPVTWDGMVLTEAGSDTIRYRSQVGTDSLVVRRLQVRQHSTLHLALEPYCDTPQHYIVTLSAAGHPYQWTSTPAMTPMAQETLDSVDRLHFHPMNESRLAFLSDYPDAPSCPGTDTLLISPHGYFYLDLVVIPETLYTDNLQMTAIDMGQNAVFRQWMVDSVMQGDTGQWIQYTVPALADSVVVVLTGGDSVCVDTVRKTVIVIREFLVFPNVFTPGLDENNRFRAFGTEVEDYELWIYDRWGMLVFYTDDRLEAWDGTHAGKPCQQATYAYVCKYSLPGRPRLVKSGTVTLLR